MARQLQLRRGTTDQHSAFAGAVAEVTVDTDKSTVVVHDGATLGGFALTKEGHTHEISDVIGLQTALDTGVVEANTYTDNQVGTAIYTLRSGLVYDLQLAGINIG